MENQQRIILFVALSVVILLLFQAWQEDYGPKPTSPVAAGTENGAVLPADVPAAPTASSSTPVAASAAGATDIAVPASDHGLASSGRVRVITDIYDLEIDTTGGDIRQVDLLKYPVSSGQPDKPFRLINDSPATLFVAQSGLLSQEGAPDHYAHYTAAQTEYRMPGGADQLRVPLTWTNGQGITVTKTYTFHRDKYLIEVSNKVTNDSAQPWNGRLYQQFQHAYAEKESAFIYTYTGGVISSEEKKYEKIAFKDMDEKDLNRDIKGGWAAMIQHYFVGAWVPDQAAQNHYYSKVLENKRYVLGMVTPALTVAPGANATFDSRLFVGPKLQHQMEAIAPGLELTVDYGVLTFIAKPLFWILEWVHSWIHNWGWSIVILTLFIKLIFFPLSAASYRSMGNMRRMAPKLQQIKERYGDDRQRMSQAMMDLYKKEKINPLGGCLPILVQIPVFIALYWVLLESVELRQAPFIGWIQDLSVRDPYYVLPLIMGVTMFIQQKLNPAPPDPIQAKILMAMPFVFTAFFAFFPAGLVLYWVANNILSIAQQWHILRGMEKTPAAAS